MKCLIIYHSLSGNTKVIAHAICRGIQLTGEHCELSKIKDVNLTSLADYDVIGLGSLVIEQKEPQNVTSFVEYKFRDVDGKYGFIFCTHGADPGYYLARMVPALRQRGLTVVGWKDWFGAGYYPACPKPYFTDGHPDGIDLQEATDFGQEIIRRIRRIERGDRQAIPEFPTGTKYDDMYRPDPMPDPEAIRNFLKAQAGIKFKVNQEKCKYPQCTFCIDNCPMQSIDFTVSPPMFDINCAKCYLCEQTCPNGAVEVDWLPFHEAHKPLIPHLIKSLEIFEKRGNFRRLIPLEDIGWDKYTWQLKKPRFKIP